MDALPPDAEGRLSDLGLTDAQLDELRRTGHVDAVHTAVTTGVPAAGETTPRDELQRQLRLRGIGDAQVEQVLRTGDAPLDDGTGRHLLLRTTSGSGFAPPGSQARATLVLAATVAVIVAIVLAFVFG